MVLNKKVVLITGASSGIGEALAKTLASKYSDVFLVLTSRNESKLEQVADKCRENGAEVTVICSNLSQVEQAKSLAEQAISLHGRVDILVNNAGYGQMGPIELIPSSAAQEQMAVNFHAPLMLAQELSLIHI